MRPQPVRAHMKRPSQGKSLWKSDGPSAASELCLFEATVLVVVWRLFQLPSIATAHARVLIRLPAHDPSGQKVEFGAVARFRRVRGSLATRLARSAGLEVAFGMDSTFGSSLGELAVEPAYLGLRVVVPSSPDLPHTVTFAVFDTGLKTRTVEV